MPPEAVVAALRVVWTTLEAMRIPAAVMGGLAMTAWHRPRFTEDVDLVIGVGELMSREVVNRLATAGVRLKSPKLVVRIGDVRFLQLVYQPPGMLLDIQIDLHLATSDFHRQAIERRVLLKASELGFEVAVISCEDLLLFKLNAGRILDRVDVGELLKANRSELDFAYLAHWAKRLKLQRAFREAWKDAFGEESPPF
jgi:hypothetical protein